MSMLSEYIKEREGFEVIENDYGFITYKISGEECYIKELYVQEQFRQLNIASKLADEVTKIAHDHLCKYLTGTVCPAANNSTISLKVLLGYGMKLHSSTNNLIIFKKDLV